MRSDLEKAWKEFKCKVEDLFALGTSLPLSLHVSAIHKVGDKLQAWKDEVEKSGKSSSDESNKQTLVAKRRRRHISDTVTVNTTMDDTPVKDTTSETVSRSSSVRTRSKTSAAVSPDVSADAPSPVKRRKRRSQKNVELTEPVVINSNDDDKRADEGDSSMDTSLVMLVKKEAERFATEAERNVTLLSQESQETGSQEAEELTEDLTEVEDTNEEFQTVAVLDCESVTTESTAKIEETIVTDTTIESVLDTEATVTEKHEISNKKLQKKQVKTEPKPKRPIGRPRKEGIDTDSKAPVKSYFCDQCSKGFVTKAAMKKHKQIHESGPLVCQVCEKQFLSYPGYTNHMKLHNNTAFQCPECPYRTGGKIWLEKHILYVHRKDDPSSRPHLCDHCGASFVSVTCLKRHVQGHTRAKIYNCPDCDHKTHNPDLLAVHRKNIHSEKDPYICNICGATCKYRGSLVEHQRRHFSEKPFKCDSCDYTCVSSTMLHKHRKKHLPPTHKCETCEKSFQTKEHLKRHAVIHTGEKLYQCQFCNYRCNVPSNLHKHMKNLHNVQHVRRIKRVEPLEEITLEPGILIESGIAVAPEDVTSGPQDVTAGVVVPEEAVPHVQQEIYLDSREHEDKEAVQMVQYVMEEFPGVTSAATATIETTEYVEHIPTQGLTTLHNIGPTEALPRVTHYSDWNAYTPH